MSKSRSRVLSLVMVPGLVAACGVTATRPLDGDPRDPRRGVTAVVTTDAGSPEPPATTDAGAGTQPSCGDPSSCRAIVELSAGGYWTCVRRADGSLSCFGSVADAPVGEQVGTPTGRYLQLSHGQYMTTCALKTDHTAECFGRDQFNSAPPAGLRLQEIAAGGFHNCGLRVDGTAECWGHEGYQQLDAPLDEFTGLAAGITHTCGLRRDGTVRCWGGISDTAVVPYPEPPAGTFVELWAAFSTCGRRPSGAIECWGPTWNGPALPQPEGDFTDFTLGSSAWCGVRPSGALACSSGLEPTPEGAFVRTSAGMAHACAERTGGQLVCWGRNLFGEATVPAGF